MNWKMIWLSLFKTTTWLGIDIGFWISMGISLLVAIIMNVVFWSLKPKNNKKSETVLDSLYELDDVEDDLDED